jgi:hypothetical protein
VGGLLLGGLTSGLVVGALAGVLSVVPQPARLVVGAGALAVILIAELAGRPLRLPQNGRAVPPKVIADAHVRGALQFGFEMGTGVRTFMPTALPHALVVAVLAAGGPLVGLVVGLGFGAGRAAMTLLRSASRTPAAWDGTLARRARSVGRLAAVAFTLLLIALIFE